MSGIAARSAAERPQPSTENPISLPSLEGLGVYKNRWRTFVSSTILHVFAIVLLLVLTRYSPHQTGETRESVIALADTSPYTLPPSSTRVSGGGGGGDRDKLAAPKGALPKSALEQLAPPAVVIRNPAPKLPVEPTVVVPPQIVLPQTGQLGDPLSDILGAPSNGPGSGGGIGSGSGGGVGSGTGPGVGPGSGGGIGGGAYRVGGGVTAPRVIYAPDPEFSDEARRAKYQGTVVLWVIVGTDGRIHDVLVYRSLGMGLDEKAIQAIRRWRFEPGRKDGVPVAVQVNVEVNFQLY